MGENFLLVKNSGNGKEMYDYYLKPVFIPVHKIHSLLPTILQKKD